MLLFSSACALASGTNSRVGLQLPPYPLAHAQKHARAATQTSMNLHLAASGGAHAQTGRAAAARRRGATAARDGKQTDTETSKSSQDESRMQIVLVTVSLPFPLARFATPPQQRRGDRPRKTEGAAAGRAQRGKRRERIVSSYNRVDWRGPY